MDFTARQIAKARGEPLENYLSVYDLNILGGTMAFDKTRLAFKLNYVVEGRVHDRPQMVKDLQALKQPHLIITLRDYWFAMLRRDGFWFLYNCHASPVGPGRAVTGEEPAAIVQALSAAEVAEILVHFVAANESFKGWFTVYEVEMSLK